MSANFERATGFMRDLGDIVGRELRARLKLPEAECAEIGMRCSRRACEEFGGELIYIPKGHQLHIDERDREMFAFYVSHGRDIQATAKQYQIGMQAAYKRIRLFEAAQYLKRQGGLFGGSDGA